MKNHSVDEDTAKETKDKDAIDRKFVNVVKQEVSQMRTKMVQQEKTNTCAATRQFILSKTMQKCMKRGEVVYLAMVWPTEARKQGITHKVKQQIMKDKGPIRKAPPIMETRKRMCSEALAKVK